MALAARRPEEVPSLICDLRPEAASLWPEYIALREAGEAVALFWPAVAAATLPAAATAASSSDLESSFESEKVAVIAAPELPEWLALDDFHRVLLISAGAEPSAEEQAMAKLLLARGCEAVESLPPAAVADLAQSWNSGRRTGGRIWRLNN